MSGHFLFGFFFLVFLFLLWHAREIYRNNIKRPESGGDGCAELTTGPRICQAGIYYSRGDDSYVKIKLKKINSEIASRLTTFKQLPTNPCSFPPTAPREGRDKLGGSKMQQEFRNKKQTGLGKAVMWKILTGLKAARVLMLSDVWKRVQASKERWLSLQLKVLLI